MKKQIYLLIIAWITITILFYLTIAFGQATLLPTEMDRDARSILACFWLITIFGITVPILIEYKDRK